MTTATYKSGDLTNLSAANIKSGVTIAGTAGQYPSATYPLANADSTADLDLASFDAKIKSATAFEWFASDGTRYTNSGDADISAANILTGTTIFGTAGSAAVCSACTLDGETSCLTSASFKAAKMANFTAAKIEYGTTIAGVAGTLNAPSPTHRIFTTASKWNGNLGGQSGADAKCQAAATAAGLSGTWKAILSTSGQTATAKLTFTKSIANMQGEVVATNETDLFDGTLTYHVGYTETGALTSNSVWTGSLNDGTGDATTKCTDWTSSTGSSIRIGRPDNVTAWLYDSTTTTSCGNSLALLCVDQ